MALLPLDYSIGLWLEVETRVVFQVGGPHDKKDTVLPRFSEGLLSQ